MIKLDHFDLEEFDSPDSPGSGKDNMNNGFLVMIDEARDIADISFVVNSGFRTKEYNKKVGGVSNSAHTLGLAADIACTDSTKRFIIINALLLSGCTRIGVAKTFIHADIDPTKTQDVIWVY